MSKRITSLPSSSSEDYTYADIEGESIATSTTELVEPTSIIGCRRVTLSYRNLNGSETVTYKVWVTNKDNPRDTSQTDWSYDWKELGSKDVGTNSTDGDWFRSEWRYVMVTATATSATSSDNSVHLLASQHK